MAKKKKRKIDIMHEEYGSNEGSICRNCCNCAVYQIDGQRGLKCKAFGIDGTAVTNWNGRYMGCGLYNMPFDSVKYKPAVRKYKGGGESGKR